MERHDSRLAEEAADDQRQRDDREAAFRLVRESDADLGEVQRVAPVP